MGRIEKEIKMIREIEIDKIYEHPNNPRKNVGDLSELCESIKNSGILQNLTVVPREKDTFTVIIGHRRLAAARMAGLEKVPCTVVEISEKEQISTMLAENMQRVDLTLREQAEGFQMMLDFGDSYEEVSKKTGVSQSTVRRRVRLLEFDKEKFDESIGRGGTIMDYEKLYEIKDPKLRDSVLDKIGTNNFDWYLRIAIENEKKAERMNELQTLLDEVALELPEGYDEENFKYIESIYNVKDLEALNIDAEKDVFYYMRNSYGFEIYHELSDDERRCAENKRYEKGIEERKKKSIFERVNRISEMAFEKRKSFVRSVSKLDRDETMRICVGIFADNSLYYDIDYEMLSECMGFVDKLTTSEICEIFKGNLHKDIRIEKALLATAYCKLKDSKYENYYDGQGKHRENGRLDRIYEVLEKMGYRMSDEESEWRKGTLEFEE